MAIRNGDWTTIDFWVEDGLDGPYTPYPGIEYAIVVALVALVIVGAGTGLGTKIKTIFTNMTTSMPTGT